MEEEHSLFIDCSNGMHVGLLDGSFRWVELVSSSIPSRDLHEKMHLLLKKVGKELKNVENFFFCKGPGSYTGLRIVGGVEEFIRWNKHKCYDFYSFELIKYLDLKKTIWITPSFKKQFFVCEKEGTDFSYQNYSEKDFEKTNFGKNETVLTSRESVSKLEKSSRNIITYEDLIKKKSQNIFQKIVELEPRSKDIFYYRPLEEEFKK